jgi:hypothetical protein
MTTIRRVSALAAMIVVFALGTAGARAEHSEANFPGIGPVSIKTVKSVGAVPAIVMTNANGKVLLSTTVGGSESEYFKIQQNADGTMNPTVHYAVLPGPDPSSLAVLAVAAATGGSDCAYEALVFGSERGKLSLWTPHNIETLAEGGIYVGDLGGRRGYGLAVWNFIWGSEPHVAPHRYTVTLYKLNRKRMQFFKTTTLTSRGHYADDMSALRELKLTFPNLTRSIPKLAC